MENDIKTNDSQLVKFVEHALSQFLPLAEMCQILKPDELPRAERIIKDSMKIIEFSPKISGHIAAYVRSDKKSLQFNPEYKKLFADAKSFDDDCFDHTVPTRDGHRSPIKQVLFHEFIHMLQHNKEKPNFILEDDKSEAYGFYTPSVKYATYNGKALDEIAAAFGDTILWESYLQEIKGDHTAYNPLYTLSTDTGDFTFPIVSTQDQPHPKSFSMYINEMSVGVRLLNTIDIYPNDFIRASTVFGDDIKQEIKAKYQQATEKDWDDFTASMDGVLFFNAQSSKTREKDIHWFYHDYGLAVDKLKDIEGNDSDDTSKWLQKALFDPRIRKRLILEDKEQARKSLILNDKKQKPTKSLIKKDFNRAFTEINYPEK